MRRKRRHDPVLLRGLHLPVERRDADGGGHGRREALRVREHVLGLHRLALLDRRADDVGLPPLRDPVQHEAQRLAPLRLSHREVLDREPVRRHLPDDRYVQVAVKDHRQRSGNRRRAHDEERHLRRLSLARKELALPDAEPVLLVRDDEREVMVVHGLLDERVRADDHVRLSRGDLLVDVPARASRDGPGQKDRAQRQVMRADQFQDALHVLRREDFRRCHQCALPSICSAKKQREKRKDRLAGADVSLQHPVHDERSCHVALDLFPRLRLVVRQSIRQRVDQPRRLCARQHRPRILQLLHSAALPSHANEESEELVEDEPVSRPPHLLRALREVDPADRLRPAEEPQLLPVCFGEAVLRVLVGGRHGL